MPEFTVHGVAGSSDWTSSHGKAMKSYDLTVADGDERTACSLNQLATTPAPAVGDVIDGTLEPSTGNYPPKLKKAPKPFNGPSGNGGGGGRMSPSESARVARMNAQGHAVAYAQLLHAAGRLPEDFNLGSLLLITGKFFADAKEAGDSA